MKKLILMIFCIVFIVGCGSVGGDTSIQKVENSIHDNIPQPPKVPNIN